MPPKRKSTGSTSQANKMPKKPKKAATPPAEPEYEPPRSSRWSAVSASANAEAEYRLCWKDEEKAYSYITLCLPFYLDSDESDDEDDDGDSEDGDSSDGEEEEEEEDDDDEGDGSERPVDGLKRQGPPCGKKQCKCFKPVAANPEHPWVITWAGYKKSMNQFLHNFVRDPDHFSMYIYNDFSAYGSLEVLENLVLDFEEAEKEQRGGWREQWAVCEAAAHWLLHRTGQKFCMCVVDTYFHLIHSFNSSIWCHIWSFSFPTALTSCTGPMTVREYRRQRVS